METSIAVWFIIIEVQFTLRKVTAKNSKYSKVLIALTPDVVTNLHASVLQSKDYKHSKQSVMSAYEKTKLELLEKLTKTTTIVGCLSVYL